MKPAILNFPSMTRGDSFLEREFSLVEDGAPKNLSGASVRMHFRNRSGVLVKSISNGSGITITNPSQGEFTINQFETYDWSAGVHTYDLEVTADGFTKTYFKGILRIYGDATQ